MNTKKPQSPPLPGEATLSEKIARSGPYHPGRTYLVLCLVYLAFVIYGSLVPLDCRPVPMEEAWRRFQKILSSELTVHSRSDLAANIMLFIPLAFMVMGAITRENRASVATRALTAIMLVPAAALLSAAIEFTQVQFPSRAVAKSDIMAETIGAVIGITLWFSAGGRITRWIRGLWAENARGKLAVKLLVGYAVLLVIYQMMPFDLTVRLSRVYRALMSARTTWIPFADKYGTTVYTPFSKTAVMIPIGMLFALLGHRKRSIGRIVLYTLGFACCIEAGQIIVTSRYPSTTDLVYGVLGGLVGALLSRVIGQMARRPVLESNFWRQHGHLVKTAAIILWVAALAWHKWYPFDFAWPADGLAARAGRLLVAPLSAQHSSSELGKVSQIARYLASFAVLGMLLARTFGATGIKAKACLLLVVGAIAVLLETGELFLATPVPDITTAVICMIGGGLGIHMADGFVNVFVRSEDSAAT